MMLGDGVWGKGKCYSKINARKRHDHYSPPKSDSLEGIIAEEEEIEKKHKDEKKTRGEAYLREELLRRSSR